ncbi:MAG TPA: hypothetical protein VJH90_01735 [archaeon]|nr:hypothetical protein [archaeon]
MVLLKILGIVLIVVGYFLIRLFPDEGEAQSGGFTMSGIILGAALLLIGIGLLIFG